MCARMIHIRRKKINLAESEGSCGVRLGMCMRKVKTDLEAKTPKFAFKRSIAANINQYQHQLPAAYSHRDKKTSSSIIYFKPIGNFAFGQLH